MSQNPRFRILTSLADIEAADWDRLANPADQPFNPFIAYDFLYALEISGSACKETGWQAQHLVMHNGAGDITGVVPCYLKDHSRGEYIFDHGWAEAFARAGGHYYPKLQVSIPFTPATGPRLLAITPDDKLLLANALASLTQQYAASSLHITFLPRDEYHMLGSLDWLQRTDTQFHWHNNNYDNFDDFLTNLSARKRKNIRKERKIVKAHNLTIECLTGSDLTEAHWDAFYQFYLDTGAKKWGTPYLTRSFFSHITSNFSQHILLIMAREKSGRYVAGALNFLGSDAVYGRHWGAIADYPMLHFECCYYQAIEFAIASQRQRVEAGAQGAHKLARGYLPVTTHSAHYIAHPAFRHAVADYLERERAMVAQDNTILSQHSPFRHDDKQN